MSDDAFSALVERVGAFHITDKAMVAAQRDAVAALARGTVTDAERRRYLGAVERYFSGFEREARAHLRDVDKRLEALSQVQFNLTAERGVAVKRIEATSAVLDALRVLERTAG
jgi:hypothetical protein